MDILIDNKSGTPIYDQIYTQLRSQILSGSLQENELLPSIRALAKDLRISFITTKRAYEELEQAGYWHYEISNAALPGYESRHNTVYWQLGEYLGIGPGAAGYCGGRRYRFPEDIEAFLAAENVWTLPSGMAP